MITDLYIL